MRALLFGLVLWGCYEPQTRTQALLLGGPWEEVKIRAGDVNHDGSDGVHLVDLDMDDDMDVCTVWEDSDTMSCHANAANGSDWPEIVGASGLDSVEGVLACYLDGDVWSDLLAFGEAAGIHVFPTQVGPLHGGQLPLTIPSDRWLGGACANVDASLDGSIDLVGFGETSRVYGFLNPGDANVWDVTAWTREYAFEAKHVMQLFLVDLFGGGRLDSIVFERIGIAGVTPGPGVWYTDGDTGDGDSVPQTSYPISIGRRAMIGDMADMTVPPDGLEELIVPYMRGNLYTTSFLEVIPRLQSAPFFGTPISIPLPAPLNQTNVDLKSAIVADFDLNGLPDIALASTPVTGHCIWALIQTSMDVFELISIDPGSWCAKVDNLEVADADGDGDPDLFWSEEQRVVDGFAYGQGLGYFRNPTL